MLSFDPYPWRSIFNGAANLGVGRHVVARAALPQTVFGSTWRVEFGGFIGGTGEVRIILGFDDADVDPFATSRGLGPWGFRTRPTYVSGVWEAAPPPGVGTVGNWFSTPPPWAALFYRVSTGNITASFKVEFTGISVE